MADLKMLAIDLGASSGRGIVGSFDGEKLTLRENHRFSNDPVFVNGRFTWDILRIFFEIKNSITNRDRNTCPCLWRLGVIHYGTGKARLLRGIGPEQGRLG